VLLTGKKNKEEGEMAEGDNKEREKERNEEGSKSEKKAPSGSKSTNVSQR
jgi:hypothetical protein